MKFQTIDEENYKFVKYKVEIRCKTVSNQTMSKSDKPFTDFNEAMAYLKKIKKEMKDYPELHKGCFIVFHKIKTVGESFLVLEGE